MRPPYADYLTKIVESPIAAELRHSHDPEFTYICVYSRLKKIFSFLTLSYINDIIALEGL